MTFGFWPGFPLFCYQHWRKPQMYPGPSAWMICLSQITGFAILCFEVKHHLNRRWKWISFMKASKLLPPPLWHIFLSVNVVLCTCACMHASVWRGVSVWVICFVVVKLSYICLIKKKKFFVCLLVWCKLCKTLLSYNLTKFFVHLFEPMYTYIVSQCDRVIVIFLVISNSESSAQIYNHVAYFKYYHYSSAYVAFSQQCEKKWS